MKRTMVCALCILLAGSLFPLFGAGYSGKKVDSPKTVTFKASDGLTVTADVYMPYDKKAPMILLCHRAKWSRGEYREIAPKLNLLGFNCVAIDQRSGQAINGVENETAKLALSKGKQNRFIDAMPDIQAGIDYVTKNYVQGKFILWGSSYSSSLVITMFAQNADKVNGVISFSPGEYFGSMGRSERWVSFMADGVEVPTFISCQPSEKTKVEEIFDNIASEDKTLFVPETPSKHGSQALYSDSDAQKETWDALKNFLNKF